MAKLKVTDVLNLLSGKTFDECNQLLDRIEILTKEADEGNEDNNEAENDDSVDSSETDDDSSEDDSVSETSEDSDDSTKDKNDFSKLQKENESLKNQIKKLQAANQHQSLDDENVKSLQEQQNDIIQKMFG